MASATQEFRYLTPPQVQILSDKKWLCYVCHDDDLNKPIVSHCGTLHASHWECSIDWLREHKACDFCRVSVIWHEIKTKEERETSLYKGFLSVESTPRGWGLHIASTIYPTVSACARLAVTCLIETSINLFACGNDFYSNQPNPIQRAPIPLKPKQGPMRIYLSRPDHFSESSSISEGPKQKPLRIYSPELFEMVKDRGD